MHTSFIQKIGQEIGSLHAESWESWRGDCQCGRIDALGFCDRCTECAIESVYENEREYGGTTESICNYLMIEDVDKYPRLIDHLVGISLSTQAESWRWLTRNCKAVK